MLKRYCDFCKQELKMIDDDRTTYTQWYKIVDGLHSSEKDICNECLTEIVKKVNHDN